MAFPQITYPATAPTTTLAFTYPPTGKPGPYPIGDQEAVGSVSLSLSGQRQVMYVRTDQFYHLKMELPWDDMAAWQAFVQYAGPGGSFLYYPDSALTAYDEYTLEDGGGSSRNSSTANISAPAWNPTMSVHQMAQFELVLRKVPGGLTSA